MRKLLLFALLFGAGLALLIVLDRRDRPESTVDPQPVENEPSQADEGPPPEPEAQGPSVRLRGQTPLSVDQPIEQPDGSVRYVPRYRLDCFLVPEGEGLVTTYRANDLVVREYDPFTETLVRTTTAATSRFTIDQTDFQKISIADGGHIELFDFEVVQHVGFAFAPVTLEAAHGEVYLETQRFRSLGEGVVTFDGQGLEGEGRGVTMEGAAGTIVFAAGGEVRMLDEDGRRGVFTTRPGGDLYIERYGDPAENRIEVVASNGGHLEVHEPAPADPATAPEPPFLLDADTLTVRGRVDAAADTSSIHRAEGRGDVVAILGADIGRGQEVDVAFDPAGVVDELELREDPTFELRLVGEDGAAHPLRGGGQGPLKLRADDGERTSFELIGPAEVRDVETGVVIVARDLLSGWTTASGDAGEFTGVGAVRVEQGARNLTTDQVVASFTMGADEHVLARCSGPTRSEFEDDAGARLQVVASEQAHVRLEAERWVVPLARGVTAQSLAPEPFAVAAPVLRDLDWQARRFEAEGGVTWSGTLGNGEAERVVARGPEEVELEGTEDVPAHLLHRSAAAADAAGLGSFDARRIQATPSGVEAWDDVRAIVTDDELQLDPSLPLRPALAAGRSRLEFDAAHLDLDVERDADGNPTTFVLESDEVTRVDLQHPRGRTTAASPRVVANGHFEAAQDPAGAPRLVLDELVASRGVTFTHASTEPDRAFAIEGGGQRLIVRGQDSVRIEVDAAQRVHAEGELPRWGAPFSIEADWVEVTPERLEAAFAVFDVDAPLAPFAPEGAPTPAPVDEDLPITGATSVRADHVLADPRGLHFAGSVHARTADREGVSLELRAGRAEALVTTVEGAEGLPWNEVLERLEADEGFLLAYGGLARARGTSFEATPTAIDLRGAPLTLEGMGHWLDTERASIDLTTFLLETDQGVIRGGSGGATWALDFSRLQPQRRGEDEMMVFVQPVLQEFDRTARADFAAMWIHPERWRSAGHEALYGVPLALELSDEPGPPAVYPATDLLANVFRKLDEGELTRYARAIYLQGDIELDQRGERVARAAEVYLDLEHRRGWMKDTDLSYEMQVGSSVHRVRTHSDMLVSTGAGSLHAEEATLTACSHEVPHYQIRTGNLNLTPRSDGLWVVSLNKNKLDIGWLSVPLGSIGNIAVNESGSVQGVVNDEGDVTTIDGFFFGSSARFGTTVGTRGTVDAGSSAQRIARLFGFRDDVQGKWKYEGRWLNSRGPLLGLGLQLRESSANPDQREDFWLNLWARGIPDEGDDRGIYRVPPDERPEFRSWFSLRGRYPFSDTEWIDVVANTQTDPGVQSEFFQREFLEFEERDTYVSWRKAFDANFLNVRGQFRIDDFRTTVERLPSAGVYHGAGPIASLLGSQLEYDATLDVANLRRREGDTRYEPALVGIDGLPDGFGDRQVLRADTRHTLRLPYDTDLGGLRATPFLDARFTAWDEAQVDDGSPTRAGLHGGLELTTNLLDLRPDGSYVTLAPLARIKEEIVVEENGGMPVRFDNLEDPINGRTVEAGLRSLWRRPDSPEELDVELVFGERSDRGDGLSDAALGTVLAHYRNAFGDMPFDLRTDTQYDFDLQRTLYSTSSVSVRPSEDLILLASYSHGRQFTGPALYQAAGLRARYRIDPKWEVEAATSISLLGRESLFNGVTLRRFAHDLVLELTVDFRRGEGAGLRVNLAPLIGWSSSRIGVLDDVD